MFTSSDKFCKHMAGYIYSYLLPNASAVANLCVPAMHQLEKGIVDAIL